MTILLLVVLYLFIFWYSELNCVVRMYLRAW